MGAAMSAFSRFSDFTNPVRTWQASFTFQPVVVTGTDDFCRSWVGRIGGKEVFARDLEGNYVLVGVISTTEMSVVS